MATKAVISSKLTVVETVSDTYASSSDQTVTLNGLDTTSTINADSTVPATKSAFFQKALSGGAATIDLTALTGLNGASVTFNGLKVQAVKFRNKATNANAITITPGASNGYNIFGASSSVTLQPGQEILFTGLDLQADVDGTHKTIDLAGTGAQVLECAFVAG